MPSDKHHGPKMCKRFRGKTNRDEFQNQIFKFINVYTD